MKPIYRYSWDHGQWALFTGTLPFQRLYVLPTDTEVLYEPCVYHAAIIPSPTWFIAPYSLSIH